MLGLQGHRGETALDDRNPCAVPASDPGCGTVIPIIEKFGNGAFGRPSNW